MNNIFRSIISLSAFLVLSVYIFTLLSSCTPTVSDKQVWSELNQISTLEGHKDDVTRAIFNTDGTKIVTLARDSTAKIWDSINGQLIYTLTGHRGEVRCVCFLDNGRKIQTFADDRAIKIWDAETGNELTSTKIPENQARIICAAFSTDGLKLAIGLSGKAEIYDTQTGRFLVGLSPFGHPGLRVNTTDIGFSNDGNRLLTASYSHEVAVWDVNTGTRLLNLHEHGQGCLTAVFSSDMTLIASGSRDKTVIIWDARSGNIIDKIDIGWEVKSVAFSPCRSSIFVVENVKKGDIARGTVWDLSTMSKIFELQLSGKVKNNSFSSIKNLLVMPFKNKAIIYSSNNIYGSISEGMPEMPSEMEELIEITISNKNKAMSLRATRELINRKDKLGQFSSIFSAALRSDKKYKRLNAALSLAEIGEPLEGIIPILKYLLVKDDDPQIRAAAALALGSISTGTGEPSAVSELIGRLKDNDVRVRYHAAHALDQMGEGTGNTLSALVETVLSDSSTGVRRQIAFNIGNAGDRSLNALPSLIEGTKSTDERERWWACYTLWCLSSATGGLCKNAIPALKIAIRDSSDYRDENGGPPYKYAIYALRGIGPEVKKVDPEIVTMLKDIMEYDDEYYQRKAAALALESILEVKGLRQKVRGFVRRQN
jgi:HEAT repeat protein